MCEHQNQNPLLYLSNCSFNQDFFSAIVPVPDLSEGDRLDAALTEPSWWETVRTMPRKDVRRAGPREVTVEGDME